MSDTTLYRLVNPAFQFEWNGKTYEVKKANLAQVVQYQAKVKELIAGGEAGADQKIAAYCIYLLLKAQEPDLTEEKVLNETPGGIDLMELMMTLGFLKPTKETTAIPEVKEQTTPDSLPPSLTELAGLPEKSES